MQHLAQTLTQSARACGLASLVMRKYACTVMQESQGSYVSILGSYATLGG